MLISLLIAVSLVFLLPDGASAGQIPFTELQMPSGQDGTTGQGDYVSSTGGLNTYLSYFIEVPPSSTTLVVDLYDADVGNLVPSDIGDRVRTAYNTSVTYTLLTPAGATQVTKTCDSLLNLCILENGTWTNLATVVNPAAGHWELRVDMGAGDDLNGFAIRAHDGDKTSRGTEYNIYADSFIDIGVHTAGGSGVYTNIFPFITSGCNFSTRDWDMDGAGSISVTSRTGAFTQTNSAVSGSTVWLTTTVPETGSGWTTDDSAGDYGIWSSNMTVSLGANYTTIYLGTYNSGATPPTTQPQANTFRMYFPTDALLGVNTALSAGKLIDATANFSDPASPVIIGDIVKNISLGTETTVTSIDSATQLGLAVDIFTATPQNYSVSGSATAAPVKPYLSQILPDIPTVITGKTTQVNIQVTITNPTPYNITFSAANLVTANVPGPTCPAATNSACYVGNSASVTQGAVNSQPADGATGNITWNPGTLLAGASASLTYTVKAAPNADGTRIPVTGTPASNGTTAKYVDETGNTTQARATYTYGPLCELAVTSVSGATGAKRFLRWREVIQ
ncbi:MAG: hypothetical protein HY035_04580 [Nitrospirae bacterium]|nr:hypothetical protein [Nitrospirota bacterium]MBI3377665.1 hypothetical protein [Nitrospirota bacterium]